jgi:predicted transcriptional regulator
MEMLSIRFMSTVTSSMFKVLIRREARASELSEAADIKSKEVLPRLRYWILKGLVKAEKDPVTNINIYSLTDYAKALISELRRFVEEVVSSVRDKKSPRKILEEAEKRYEERFGKHMPEHYKLVLGVFIEYALSKSSPYIAVKPGEETLPQVIKTIILQRYGRNLDAEEIIEALKELELAKIIYIDHRRFKARLDKSLV